MDLNVLILLFACAIGHHSCHVIQVVPESNFDECHGKRCPKHETITTAMDPDITTAPTSTPSAEPMEPTFQPTACPKPATKPTSEATTEQVTKPTPKPSTPEPTSTSTVKPTSEPHSHGDGAKLISFLGGTTLVFAGIGIIFITRWLFLLYSG